jgi:hypothetical protein
MNEENNITQNDEPIKIEYVNPLNPNEVLNQKNSINVETTVENINSIENNEIDNNTDNDNNETDNNEQVEITITPKGKNKLIIIIVVLVALSVILFSILLAPKILNKKVEQPIQQPTEEVKITLQNIITNSANNAYFKLLTSTYVVNITNVDNSIVFDLNSIDEVNQINKQIIFNLENRDLKITLNKYEDNTDELNALYAIADSIGQYYGHEIDEVGNYLYTLQNNYNFNVGGITTTDIEDTLNGINAYEISINIDTNISTTTLDSMYFSLDELTLYENEIKNNTVDLKKGDLVLYTNNSDEYTILIGERNSLTSNTYNTITSLIELLYPEEIQDFKSKFTTLSTISFDKYKITIDPILDENTYPQYQTDYKFILIEIENQILQ